MKIITILKYLIDFIFLAFLVSAVIILAIPFLDQSYTQYYNVVLVLIISPLIHLFVIFMILYYLRKFVHNASIGATLDKSTRKYLKLSGVYCFIYGLLQLPLIYGIITFISVTGEYNTPYVMDSLLHCGSIFYYFLIGLFLIYLSKVLETSDIINQENKLTI